MAHFNVTSLNWGSGTQIHCLATQFCCFLYLLHNNLFCFSIHGTIVATKSVIILIKPVVIERITLSCNF